MDLPVTYEFVTRDNIPKTNCPRMQARHFVLFALAIMTSVPALVSMLNQPKRLVLLRLQVQVIQKILFV